MMIYRSLVVGLLAAVAMLLTEQGAQLERLARPAPAGDRCAFAGDPPPMIVHISARGAGADPLAVLGLGPTAVPLTIDDRPIRGAWPDAIRARWRQTRPGGYFELWVWTPDRTRRMLVLVTA